MVAKALAYNKNLLTVILRDTEIKDAVAKQLASSLRINKSLKNLNVDFNSLTPYYV